MALGEHERNGTANIFAFAEPLTGRRRRGVTAQRTRSDGAHAVRDFVDVHNAKAKRLLVVMDNHNAHRLGFLYETFPSAEARRSIRKIEAVHAPTRGSWLNAAEIELNVQTRQSLSRRIPDQQTLTADAAWRRERNRKQKGVDRRLTTEKARLKLERLFPRIHLRRHTSDFRSDILGTDRR